MELPGVGKHFDYCRCCFSRCNSGLQHGNVDVLFEKQYIVLRSAYKICTIFNVGFDVVRQYNLNGGAVLCVGKDKTAVCEYPGICGGEIITPSKLTYFDDMRAVLANYKRVTDTIEILALKERVAKLEQFIKQHLYYSPGGVGANAAGVDWAGRLPGVKE